MENQTTKTENHARAIVTESKTYSPSYKVAMAVNYLWICDAIRGKFDPSLIEKIAFIQAKHMATFAKKRIAKGQNPNW